jgi:adenylosuccinate lyase
MNSVESLSVFDGRYQKAVRSLAPIFSEAGLIRHRIEVEVRWLIYLGQHLSLFQLSPPDIQALHSLLPVADEAITRVKAIEATTNHDVKAVEYYIKESLETIKLARLKEWVHFACTSEDINNTAYALMLKKGVGVLVESARTLLHEIEDFAFANKAVPMMSRTHGQPASPTTVGKEMINFAHRLREAILAVEQVSIKAKLNGATGNFNAHRFVFPDIDWLKASRTFIEDSLQLEALTWTTQINTYSSISELMHALIRLASILIDFDRDLWGYIALDYFKQKLKEGEVGSSTMPHKVNPIDFENSEGNLGLGIALMEHLATKLQQSRFQRDLTDSTVLRNLGLAFGYVLIAINATRRGCSKLSVHHERIAADLNQQWALLAEPYQMLLRVSGIDDPYERMKALTRGTNINQQGLHQFVDTLDGLDSQTRQRLKDLTPQAYVGAAVELVDLYQQTFRASSSTL